MTNAPKFTLTVSKSERICSVFVSKFTHSIAYFDLKDVSPINKGMKRCNTARRKHSTNANKFNKVIKQIIKMIIFLMSYSSDLISQFSLMIVH